MKLTPWFPPDVKPVRSGVYERQMPDGWGKYSYWNAKEKWWGAWGWTIEIATKNAKYQSSLQYQRWRGLAEKP